MEPLILDAAGWALIGNTIAKLAVFVVLTVLGAFSMLLSRAVLPSLLATHQLASPFLGHRRALMVVGLVAFALALVQLVRALSQALAILQVLYPRFGF